MEIAFWKNCVKIIFNALQQSLHYTKKPLLLKNAYDTKLWLVIERSGVPFNFNYFQFHSDSDWSYESGFYLWVK